MKKSLMFLLAFCATFIVICVGGKIFGYGLDGVAVFIGSFIIAGACASANNNTDNNDYNGD